MISAFFLLLLFFFLEALTDLEFYFHIETITFQSYLSLDFSDYPVDGQGNAGPRAGTAHGGALHVQCTW